VNERCGEQFPRAFGWLGIDFAVQTELKAGRGMKLAEGVDEFDQGGGLAGVGLMVTEVPDETDADGDFIQAFACKVPALDLFDPALANFDLAIARVGAVTDDEVVCHSVLHSTLFVIGIEDTGVPATRAAVVDHDVFPIAEVIFGRVDLGFNRRNEDQLGRRRGRGSRKGCEHF